MASARRRSIRYAAVRTSTTSRAQSKNTIMSSSVDSRDQADVPAGTGVMRSDGGEAPTSVLVAGLAPDPLGLLGMGLGEVRLLLRVLVHPLGQVRLVDALLAGDALGLDGFLVPAARHRQGVPGRHEPMCPISPGSAGQRFTSPRFSPARQGASCRSGEEKSCHSSCGYWL